MMIGTGIFGTLRAATAEAGSGILLVMIVGGFVALMTASLASSPMFVQHVY